jgi:3-oxoadipate enol-lactonase
MRSDGVEHRFAHCIRIGNERVDVVRLGRGAPIILVPGLAGSWKLLLPLARALARHFEVITYELRGDQFTFGGIEADRARVGDVAEHARDLGAVIDQLGLAAPIIFGVSFGGMIALELATASRHRLGALILSGAEARFRPTLASSIARRVLERFPLPNDNRFVNQFFHLLYGAKPHSGPLLDFVIDRIWETDQSVIARRLIQLETFDVSDRLWTIDAPSLILAGANDVIVPLKCQRALANAIPGAQFSVIEGAGHIGFLTHRAQIVRYVRRHLQRVEPRSSSMR